MNTPAKPRVQFHPINDQILLRMDVQQKSILERGVNDRPTVLPSGVVVEVGKGVFAPGVGWIEPQVKPGDHVAVSMDGPWTNLPLSEEPEEIYVAVSESLIIGKIEGADKGSAWFKTGDAPSAITRVVGGRR